MSRCLVTGAAGFVGANLVHRLLKEGHQVSVILRNSSNAWRISKILKFLDIYPADLTDFGQVEATIQLAKPERIYHLAAHGAYSTQNDANAIVQTNIIGTWNLLQATKDLDYELFVNTGSSSEYGFKGQAMREDDHLEPNSYYSVTKAAQSMLCQYFAKKEGKSICTFRLFSVYGPYEEPTRLVPNVIKRALANETVEISNPIVARDFVYVDDVVDAYMLHEELANQEGEIYNVGTGIQSTVQDVVDIVLSRTTPTCKVKINSSLARHWDAVTWVADVSLARRSLEWKAKTSLEEGLQKTIDWMRQNA